MNHRCETFAWRCARYTAVTMLVSLPSPGSLREASALEPEPGVVLALTSDNDAIPGLVTLLDGMREVLRPSGVRLEVEDPELTRFSAPSQDRALAELLAERYGELGVRVVVVVGRPAATFASRYGPGIWPSAAFVFLVAPEWAAANPLPPRSVVLTANLHYARTLAAALTLFPDTNEVVLAVGSGASDRRRLGEARQALGPFEGRVGVTELAGLPLAELERRVSDLPPHALLFPLVFFEDERGQRVINRDVIGRLAQVANRPAVTVHDTVLGLGVVGGVLGRYREVGLETGETVRALLNGPRAPETQWTPVDDDPPLQLDWRQLRRWGVEARVPAGAVVHFREAGLWTVYRWPILGGVALVLLQGGIIGVLLAQRRSRQAEHRWRLEAEVETRRHLTMMAHMDRRATVGELTASLAHELNQPLSAILRNAEAATMLLSSSAPALDEVREILQDIRSDDKRASEIIRRMRTLLRKQEIDEQPVDLNAVALETVAFVAPDAASKGVRTDIDLLPMPCMAMGDRIHLQQVVLNLVLNGMEAMARTPPDQRRLIVRTRRDNGSAELAVADAGCGIALDALPHIFDPFFTTGPNGMGMGLSIARSIVEAHGGRIFAENNAKGGATVRFTLPVPREAGVKSL